MKQLEIKFYSRKEIAEILNLNIADSKHFKRNLENKLIKWGYSYDYSRKGVSITRQPETAKEKLKEIMIRKYDLDLQVDIYEFSVFLYCLLINEDFSSMPWQKRSVWLKQEYNIDVNERTLRNWCSKFISHGTIIKNKDKKTFWKSTRVDNETRREIVEKDDVMRKEYWKDFWKLQKEKQENIHQLLWQKYGCCYYSCGTLELSAFDDVMIVQEIIELIEEIAAQPSETVVSTVIKLIDVPVSSEKFKF